MEEQKDKCAAGCTCGCCGSGRGMGCGYGWHGGGGTRMLFRALLGVIILVLVFWFGVKLGELRESIRGYDGYGSGGYYPVRMMQGYGVMSSDGTVQPPSAVTPSAGAATK